MNSLVDINCRILFVDWRARARVSVSSEAVAAS